MALPTLPTVPTPTPTPNPAAGRGLSNGWRMILLYGTGALLLTIALAAWLAGTPPSQQVQAVRRGMSRK